MVNMGESLFTMTPLNSPFPARVTPPLSFTASRSRLGTSASVSSAEIFISLLHFSLLSWETRQPDLLHLVNHSEKKSPRKLIEDLRGKKAEPRESMRRLRRAPLADWTGDHWGFTGGRKVQSQPRLVKADTEHREWLPALDLEG